jgi:pyrroline-5-carboxylate reductase
LSYEHLRPAGGRGSNEDDLMQAGPDQPIVLAGCGRMGGAILRGLESQPDPNRRVYAVDPLAPQAAGAVLLRSFQELPALDGALVLIAVKPYAVAELLPMLRPLAEAGGAFISIAAGVTIDALRAGLGGQAPVVRAMPNTPAAVLRGITALAAGPGVDAALRARCEALLGVVGEVVWLDDEAQIDAVTGLSGSGPAYFFRFAEALAQAGEALGLSAEVAMRLARRTLEGSGALAEADRRPLAELRVEVTSPGGTTAAALAHFESGGLDALLADATRAARDRAVELGQA